MTASRKNNFCSCKRLVTLTSVVLALSAAGALAAPTALSSISSSSQPQADIDNTNLTGRRRPCHRQHPLKHFLCSSDAEPRRLKRSGISDQRLAEVQMIRALKRQLERAAKLAATQTISSTPPSQEVAPT